jgi:hypothetical protein
MFLKSGWYLAYEYGNALVESECGAVPLNGYTRVVSRLTHKGVIMFTQIFHNDKLELPMLFHNQYKSTCFNTDKQVSLGRSKCLDGQVKGVPKVL